MIGGLKKPRFSNTTRLFSWKKKFGALPALPTEDFEVWTPREVKNQGITQTCVANAVASAAEPQTGQVNDECFEYAAIKKLEGSVNDGGSDPIDGCKAAIKFGLLKKYDSPFKVLETPVLTFADLKNYPQDKIIEAGGEKEVSYYSVKGLHGDLFDSIRDSLYRSLRNGWPAPVMVGTEWRVSWLNQAEGIIASDNGGFSTSHEFVCFGQKNLPGFKEPLLKMLLSSGTTVGQGGIFYMTREVVNAFSFALAFAPGNPDDNKALLWNLYQKLFNLLWSFLKLLQGKVSGLVKRQNGRRT